MVKATTSGFFLNRLPWVAQAPILGFSWLALAAIRPHENNSPLPAPLCPPVASELPPLGRSVVLLKMYPPRYPRRDSPG